MARAKATDPQKFWQDYAEQLGEKVLSYTLGHYQGGWEEYDPPLWGLIIATDKSFRFHHFPQDNWLAAISRAGTGGDGPKEKIISIPRERIVSVQLAVQTSWWKKLFFTKPPVLRLRYRTGSGDEAELFIETDKKAAAIVESLSTT
jgi:hypothetical protein